MTTNDQAAEASAPSVADTLTLKFDRFSPAERKVARRILETPQLVAKLNVSQLAEVCQVSDATVVRMSQHAGYSGYYQMRIFLMRDLDRGRRAERPVIATNPVSYSFERDLLYLKTLCSPEVMASIERAAEMVMEAETAYVVAVGNTTPIADDLEFRLNTLGVRAFTAEKIESQMRYVMNARAGDVVIIISKSGSSVGVMQVVEVATERGAHVLAITGSETSPLSKAASLVVSTGNSEKVFDQLAPRVETHLGELFVTNALVFQVDIRLRSQGDSPTGEELELSLSSFKM